MTEIIIGGILLIAAIIIYRTKNKSKKQTVEKPEVKATVLPTPPRPK